MAEPNKDTIYIDIDDEITGIIDKLHGSKGKIVALVLPKRAGVFQSIVNMKLLKRAADDAKKHLVLITTEAGLLPLAGAAGVHVAKTLTSKPEIPTAPLADDAEEEAVEETGDEPEITANPAGDQPVGKLAGLGATAVAADGVETLELDDDELPEDAAGTPGAAKPKNFKPPAAAKKGKKDKKLHVPNFNRFRLLLIIGGSILVLLIIGAIIAFNILPKATVNISTDATNVSANLNLNLSTSANTLDPTNNTVPAKLVSQQKTYTQTVATTGQKNEGNKASGSITITNCGSSDETIPAGTGFSSSGYTFISQSDVTVPVSDFKGLNGPCKNDGTANVNVIAQSGGSAYNLPNGASYTIASGPENTSAQGGAMSGGTDNNVQVVNQNDINNAKSKITTTNDSTQKQALQNQLQQDGYYAIAVTYSAGTPAVTTSANVGDTANSVTVTEVTTYSMFGVHQSDLKTLVDNNVQGQINTSKQSILSEGLDTAVFSVNNATGTTAQLTMQATAVAGPQLNTNGIKQEVAGQKPGNIKSQLETDPDVTNVTIKLSPFWVTSVPKKTSRITVDIAKPTTTQTSNANANSP
ncbi:MAG TPA: hypothetical protein VK712_02625 [Verrucomicrobiae bacterium]|nr:hypothetical protein [Verrucomicrobiae bacterium]